MKTFIDFFNRMIGIAIFKEPLSSVQIVGIILGTISLIILSWK